MLAKAALIWAWVPDSVKVALLLAPALMVAPPARLTVTRPLATVRRVVARLPSTSLTLTPAMASATSSVAACAPGTVLTGASLITITLIVVTAATELKTPSFTTVLMVRGVAVGFCVVFSN